MKHNNQTAGLKRLREPSSKGPVDPNKYWQRKPANRCKQCGFRIRGANHERGSHHNGSGRPDKH